MNRILKAVLGIGHVVVDTVVPGGSVATAAAEGIIAARKTPEKGDDVEAIFQTLVASIQLAENLGGHFANEPGFQSGLYQIKAGATLMAASIRAHRPIPTS